MANQLARQFRRSPTLTERALWSELRKLRANGYHFRRQVPIQGFIVDFACLRQRLIVEVDGTQHRTPQGVRADTKRDQHLHWKGYDVLRFTNAEVKDNLPGVIASILLSLGATRE